MIRVHPCLISVLGSPSGSIAEVNARQSLVAFFHARPHLRNDLVGALRDLEDATRIVQKFLLGRGDASDLSAMSACISIWAAIRSRIELEKVMEGKERDGLVAEEWGSLDALLSRMNDFSALQSRIGMALQGLRAEADDAEELDEMDTDNVIPPNQDGAEGDLKWQVGNNWTFSPE